MTNTRTPAARPFLAIERMHLAARPELAADATYVALMIAQTDAATAYDAATDGALHHAYDRDTADRMYYAVKREYDRASSEFINYKRGM